MLRLSIPVPKRKQSHAPVVQSSSLFMSGALKPTDTEKGSNTKNPNLAPTTTTKQQEAQPLKEIALVPQIPSYEPSTQEPLSAPHSSGSTSSTTNLAAPLALTTPSNPHLVSDLPIFTSADITSVTGNVTNGSTILSTPTSLSSVGGELDFTSWASIGAALHEGTTATTKNGHVSGSSEDGGQTEIDPAKPTGVLRSQTRRSDRSAGSTSFHRRSAARDFGVPGSRATTSAGECLPEGLRLERIPSIGDLGIEWAALDEVSAGDREMEEETAREKFLRAATAIGEGVDEKRR